LDVVAAVDAHHVFAFHGSVGRDFSESVFTITHRVDFTIGEETESVRGNNIFASNSIFFLFSSIFSSLFSLGFRVEVRKLTSFDLSDFRVFSGFLQFFGVLEDLLDHDVIRIPLLFLLRLGLGGLFGLEEGRRSLLEFGALIQALEDLLEVSGLLFGAAGEADTEK